MTKEMTEHYTSHADRATKREKLAALPMFKALTVQTRRKELTEQTRQQIIKAIQTADDDMLNRIALIVLPVKPKTSRLHNTEPEKSSR
jgi:type I site-specific restriction endonuclease